MSERSFGQGSDFWADPVEFTGAHWGFWDETWASFHEPFPTEEAARKALKAYCVWLETGETNETL